jgi:tetratricopeptide (TPR) repeat protein
MQARFFLGGSVRNDRKSVQAALHLVDSSSGAQIWSRTFKVSLDARKLIATQETIAREVIAIVADHLGIVAKQLSREASRRPPSEWRTFEAMLHYHHALARSDEEDLLVSRDALEAALKHEPDYGPAWAALGNLWLLGYTFGGIDETTAFEQASEWIDRGAELDPDNQLARTVRASAFLLRGDDSGFEREAEIALQLNPGSPYYVGTIGYLVACSGDLARGLEMVDWAIGVSARHPNWFHHIPFLDSWKRGDFETATYELDLPTGRSWEFALRGCALDRLDRKQEAEQMFAKATAQDARFSDRARHMLGGLWRDEEVSGEILEIFRRYGVEV